ncbi:MULTISPECIES: type II toxin-antitoxin system HipA family toxin [Bacteroides]|jgi:serine/threonine-protein kinase HipA|uniref:type II toxin-antitoxin system HipA family toxin n=1 Tax=Bacteroides TaxID=816 RepID=UPI000E550ECE|nr:MULTISPECIES: HipA domain-containing protein [Bacteroides]RHL05210.1 type II toxin-antitoxin system HipA family toxin [Bacteroides sp. AF39-11AC]
MMKLTHCPSTLVEGYETYSPVALRNLFAGKKVSHILPYDSPEKNEEDNEKFIENIEHISISGVQDKEVCLVEKGKIRLSQKGEQSTHILKPIPLSRLRRVKEIPANENLTMQIASQVYGIETAANGLCFFQTGESAYITKRFDVGVGGVKLRKEDFSSLASLMPANGGSNYKYEYSYEELAELIQRYIPAWRIEIEKYFKVVLFNFLFSNGDAHLKNFSVLETSRGDFRLAPAYDLLNTHLHVDDSDFALSRGLFREGDKSEFLKFNGKANGRSFNEFGKRIGINEKRVVEIITQFTTQYPLIEQLIEASFLLPSTKETYLADYRQRRNRLKDMK